MYEQLIINVSTIQKIKRIIFNASIYLIDWVYLQSLTNVSTTYKVYQTNDVYQVLLNSLSVSTNIASISKTHQVYQQHIKWCLILKDRLVILHFSNACWAWILSFWQIQKWSVMGLISKTNFAIYAIARISL